MYKWPVQTGLVRARSRASELSVTTARHFHSSPYCAEGEDRPSTQSTPVRSRSATNSANVWSQVRNLPTQSSNASRGQVTFDDAVKAAGGRPIQSSMSGDRPREVVRRFVAAPQTPSKDGARPIMARFQRPNNQSRGSQVQRGDRSGAAGSVSSERRDTNFVQRGGRGGGRGARGGGREGRGGRGGGARGPQRRRYNPANEDDTNEGDEEEEEYTGYYQVLTSDEFIDNFTSLDEAQSYANLQEFVDEYEEATTVLDLSHQDAQQQTNTNNNRGASDNSSDADQATKDHEAMLAGWDPEIKQALDHLVSTDEAALPRHPPTPFSLSSRPKGQLGDAPIGGPQAMSSIVEDGLRLLASRTGHQYVEPKTLARRLVAGEFVKFRNAPEKAEVLRHAENMGYSPDTPQGEAHVGFEALGSEGKREVVRRLVEGKYVDPADGGIKSEALRNAARIVGGNASVGAEGKGRLLGAIRALLPGERGGKGVRAGA